MRVSAEEELEQQCAREPPCTIDDTHCDRIYVTANSKQQLDVGNASRPAGHMQRSSSIALHVVEFGKRDGMLADKIWQDRFVL